MFRFGATLFFFFASLAIAQIHPHFGVEAGTPLTDTLASGSSATISNNLVLGSLPGPNSSVLQYSGHTRRLLIGPTFRVELAHGLGIEFDALYQRLSYDEYFAVSPPLSYTFTRAAANRWQFPLLMQYNRKVSKVGTFVEAGPSILHVTAGQGTSTSVSSTSLTSVISIPPTPSVVTTTQNLAGFGSTSAGLTAGGGIDVPIGRIHLRPEFRYSRWFSPVSGSVPQGIASIVSFFPSSAWFVSSPLPVAPSFTTKRNEASFLLGISF